MKKSPLTLRSQLLRWLTIPLSVLWLISTTVDYNVALNAANQAYDQSLFNKLTALLKQVDVDNGRLHIHLPQEALDILNSSGMDKIYYQVRIRNGAVFFGYPDLPLPDHNGREPQYFDASYQGENVRIVSMLAKINGQDVLVQVARTTFARQQSITSMLLSMAIPQILLVLMALVSVWYAIGRGLYPLLEIRDEITQRALSDLSPVPEERVPQEIQPLIQGFNELIARLADLLAAQQRFIADAAHQLRTPLAGLKAQSELALRLKNPEEMAHSLQQIHTATKQANRLAQQLLTLARAEPEAQQQSTLEEIDLLALSRKIVGDWIPVALEKNIDLGFEGEEQACQVRGNALLLGEMLNNLVDNALRYTPSGGVVTVRLETLPGSGILSVEDNGPGIPPSARDLVFERFYRILGSNQEGCGLGLAIVREIAHRHGTEVEIKSGPGDIGTVMRIAFKRSR